MCVWRVCVSKVEYFSSPSDKDYSDEVIEENVVKYRFLLYQRTITS